MHHFKQLKIWERSMSLVTKIYKLSASFPDLEKFGLLSQIRRCSISIPSNIAEGAGRNSDKGFIQFLSIALGSAFELETQLILSLKLKYLTKQDVDETLVELNEIQKMIRVFMDNLKSKV